MCGKMELGCFIHEGFQSVQAAALDQLHNDSNEAALSSLHSLATFWFEPRTPELASQHGQTWTDSPTVEFMHQSLLGITAAVFAVAVLIAGIRIAWEQRARPLQELLKATLVFIMASAAGTAVLQCLATWSDQLAVHLVTTAARDGSLATSFGGQVDENGAVDQLVAANVPTLLAISICGSVIIASLIQVVLMLVRAAMLVLLAGTFPLAAAATNTEIGKTWFKKYCGWSLAFIAYKPAAALVYAAALKLSQANMISSSDSLVQAMTGIMMLLLAIFALPALLRFLVPVTAAVAGGSAAMGSSVADPGGVASGAINIGRGMMGSGSSGGGAGSGGGGGASGAKIAGSAGLGAAGAAVTVARKAGGALAGAAAHSAGESGGGVITPGSAAGPISRPRGSRSASPAGAAASSLPQSRTVVPTGPSGSR